MFVIHTIPTPNGRANHGLRETRVVLAAGWSAVLWVLFGTLVSGDGVAAEKQQVIFRRPAALVAVDNWLFVANRQSGSISVIDAREKNVASELKTGLQLSDLVAHGSWLFATDEQQHQLIALLLDGGKLTVRARMPVAHYPVSVSISPDGNTLAVASLWSRQVSLFKVGFGNQNDKTDLSLTRRAVIDLPMAPRKQWISRDGRRLVVADAFGGNLAMIDVEKCELVAVRTIHGHNIRGLATSHNGKELHVTHQMLNGRVPTTRERVFWGAVLGNIVKSIRFEELFAPPKNPPNESGVENWPIAHWSLLPLGRPSNAAGDPGPVVVNSDGAAVFVLSGVNEIALRTSPRQPLVRRAVGRRPSNVTLSPDHRLAYVANTLDDSVSVVDIANLKVTDTISLGPQPESSLADRGEQLFYDARLSLDGWYSCHSCHTDGHTSGLLNDNLGDESYGAPKRILSLLGVGKTGPWAWNGGQRGLKPQLHKSITVTMQGKEQDATDENLAALQAYLHTLSPPPSLTTARGTLRTEAIQRGRQVFHRTGCIDCHREPTYTSSRIYDVGLRDELGTKKFNPPSLRGVSQGGPYFHDNRAKTLHDVFTKFKHEGGGDLEPEELKNLLEFLRSL